MSSPTITVRRLGPNNDPYNGQSGADFISDLSAVAQLIYQRLYLFQQEWFADTSDGLPLWQSILGQSESLRNQQAISLLIQERILGTPYVTGLSNVQYSCSNRSYQFYAVVQTIFGNVVVSNYPQPPSHALQGS